MPGIPSNSLPPRGHPPPSRVPPRGLVSADGFRACEIRMSAQRSGSFTRAPPRTGPWSAWLAKSGYRAPYLRTASATMSRSRRCSIWLAGACSWPGACSNNPASASHRLAPKLAMSLRPRSIAPSRNRLASLRARGDVHESMPLARWPVRANRAMSKSSTKQTCSAV